MLKTNMAVKVCKNKNTMKKYDIFINIYCKNVTVLKENI